MERVGNDLSLGKERMPLMVQVWGRRKEEEEQDPRRQTGKHPLLSVKKKGFSYTTLNLSGSFLDKKKKKQ